MMNSKLLLLVANSYLMLSIFNGCAQPQYNNNTANAVNQHNPPMTLEQRYEQEQRQLNEKLAKEKAEKESTELKYENAKLYGEHYKCSNEKSSFDLIFHNGTVVTYGKYMSNYYEEGIYKKWRLATSFSFGDFDAYTNENIEFNSETNTYTSSSQVNSSTSFDSRTSTYLEQYKCKRIK